MIFAFDEEGTLSIYATEAEAVRQYEGIDVESGVVRFYDDAGTWLEPRFVKPNRRGRTLGLINWVESGTYELVPNPSAQLDPFALALRETSFVNPNQWFATLTALKTTLAARGVVVDYP